MASRNGAAVVAAAATLLSIMTLGAAQGTDTADPAPINDAAALLRTAMVLGVATVLVFTSIGLEHGQVWLLRTTSTTALPVITSLFQQLTLLGAVGMLLFIVDASGLIKALSGLVFGDDQRDVLPSIVRQVDLVLTRSP